MAAVTDPVLARRARIARWCAAGKRAGYSAYAAAVVLFFAGVAWRFTGALVTTIVVLMVAGGAVLIPAIIFGYGVRAAQREDAGP